MKILGITAAPRREGRQERKAKSSRATEQGIAGHKAAMAALKPVASVENNVIDRHKPSEDF